MIIDNLIEKIIEKKSPIVMGIDPKYESLPNCIKENYSKDLNGLANGTVEFAKKLIDATYDIIPAIKPIKPRMAWYLSFISNVSIIKSFVINPMTIKCINNMPQIIIFPNQFACTDVKTNGA